MRLLRAGSRFFRRTTIPESKSLQIVIILAIVSSFVSIPSIYCDPELINETTESTSVSNKLPDSSSNQTILNEPSVSTTTSATTTTTINTLQTNGSNTSIELASGSFAASQASKIQSNDTSSSSSSNATQSASNSSGNDTQIETRDSSRARGAVQTQPDPTDEPKFALITDQESVSPASDSVAGEQHSALAMASTMASVEQSDVGSSSGHRQGRSSNSSPANNGQAYSAPLTSRLSAYSPATMLAQGSRLGSSPNDPIHASFRDQFMTTTAPPSTTTTTTTPAPKPVSDPVIVCYLGSWSVYRPGLSKFTPENINPFLCTHVIYAFAGLSSKLELKPFDSYNDITQGGYRKFTSLKEHNKQLKTLIAVGGWNEGSSRFSRLVGSADLRANFVQSAIRFLREHKFDGLDLDWEYPGFRDGSSSSDKEKYASLIKELRLAFDKDKELHPNSNKLLLSVAVPAGQDNIDNGFDVATISDNVDFMNVLTYDYYTAFDKQANHHAPLTLRDNQVVDAASKRLTVDWTINYYLSLGANPAKLIVGVPTYGRSYTLGQSLAPTGDQSAKNRLLTEEPHELAERTGLGSLAEGPGEEGSATREKGYLAYYEICQRTDQEQWSKEQYASKNQGPIAFKGNQWVSYDDLDSVIMKTQYVVKRGLGGVMVWTLDNDDFRASCPSSKGQESPLISAIRDTLIKSVIGPIVSETSVKPITSSRARPTTSTTTTTTTTTTTSTTTTPAPPSTQASTTDSVVMASEDGASNELAASSSDESSTGSSASGLLRNLATGKAQQLIPTTPEPGAAFTCKDEGFFANPKDCKKYFWCLDSGPANLGVVAHAFTCPSGLVFNPQTDGCDYAEKVGCKSARKSTTTSTTTTSTTSTTTTSTTARPKSQQQKIDERQQQQQFQSSDRGRLVVKKRKPASSSTTTTSTTTTTTTSTTTTTTPAPPQPTTSPSMVSTDFNSAGSDIPVTNDINELVASMLQNPQFAQVISSQLMKSQNKQTAGDANSVSSSSNPTIGELSNAAELNGAGGLVEESDSITANMSNKQAHDLLQLLNLIQSMGGVDKIAPYLANQLANKNQEDGQPETASVETSPTTADEGAALASFMNNNKLIIKSRKAQAANDDQSNGPFVFNYNLSNDNSGGQQQPGASESQPGSQQLDGGASVVGRPNQDQSLSAEVMQNIAQLESLFAYNQPGRQLMSNEDNSNFNVNNNNQLRAQSNNNNKQQQLHFINPASQQQFTLNDAKVLMQPGGFIQQQPPNDQTMIRVKVPDQHHHHHHHHHHHQNKQVQTQKQQQPAQAQRTSNQHRSGSNVRQQQTYQNQQAQLASRTPPTKLSDYNNLLPYLEGDVRQPVGQQQGQLVRQAQQQATASVGQQTSRRQPQSTVGQNVGVASTNRQQSFSIPINSFAVDSIEPSVDQQPSEILTPAVRQQNRNRPQSAQVNQATLIRQQQQSHELQPDSVAAGNVAPQQPRSRRPPNREHNRAQRLNTQDFPLPVNKQHPNKEKNKPKSHGAPKQNTRQHQPQTRDETTITRSLVLLSEGPPSIVNTPLSSARSTNTPSPPEPVSAPLSSVEMALSDLSDSLSDSALEEKLRLLESGLFPPPTTTSPKDESFRDDGLITTTTSSRSTTNSVSDKQQASHVPTISDTFSSSMPTTNDELSLNVNDNQDGPALSSFNRGTFTSNNYDQLNSSPSPVEPVSTSSGSSSPPSSPEYSSTLADEHSSTLPSHSTELSTSSKPVLGSTTIPNSASAHDSSLSPGANYDPETGLLVCNRRGVFAHPKSCGQFIVCAPQSRSQRLLRPFEHHCPSEHIFHDSWGRCRPKSLQSDLTKLCQATEL